MQLHELEFPDREIAVLEMAVNGATSVEGLITLRWQIAQLRDPQLQPLIKKISENKDLTEQEGELLKSRAKELLEIEKRNASEAQG